MARSLSLALTLLLGATPALAQSRPAAAPAPRAQPAARDQATPEQIRQFVTSFEAGVNTGCLRNPPRDLANPSRYCACYARTLVTQYQPGELAAINNLAAASKDNANLISLMAAPFARACRTAVGTSAAPAGGRR